MTEEQAHELVDRIATELGVARGFDTGVCAYEFNNSLHGGAKDWAVAWYIDPYARYSYLSAMVEDLIIQAHKPVEEIKKLADKMRRVFHHMRTRQAPTGKFINPDDASSFHYEGGKFETIKEYFPNLAKWQNEEWPKLQTEIEDTEE